MIICLHRFLVYLRKILSLQPFGCRIGIMLAQDRQTELSRQYIQCENKVYLQTRTTVRATNAPLSHYTKRYVSISFGWYKLDTTLTWYLRPMSHLQFYRAILSSSFIARQNRKCDMPCRTLQLCRINKNWPISIHRIFATKLHRIERCCNRKRSCATVKKLRYTPCRTCDFVAR